MSERIDVMYRRHRIIAGDRQAGPAAVIYDGSAKLHEARGSTVATALVQAKSWIATCWRAGERNGGYRISEPERSI